MPPDTGTGPPSWRPFRMECRVDPKLRNLIDRTDLDALLSPPQAPFRDVVDPARASARRPRSTASAPPGVPADDVVYLVPNRSVRSVILVAAGGPIMLIGMMLLEVIWSTLPDGGTMIRAALTVIPVLMIGYLPYRLLGRRGTPRRPVDSGSAMRGPGA